MARCPTQSSSREKPGLSEVVVQRFGISQAYFMASAQRRSLLPAVIPRGRATVLSRRSSSAKLHDAVVLRCMRRGCLVFYPQLLQERLEFAVELSSTVGADGADLDACGGDVFRDEFTKIFRSVAFMLEEANELEAGKVVHAQHRVPIAAERSHMKGTLMSMKNRSARSLVRRSIDFGTA